MRGCAVWSVLLVLTAASAGAADWELELALGAGRGPRPLDRVPFVFGGARFESDYLSCPIDPSGEPRCGEGIDLAVRFERERRLSPSGWVGVAAYRASRGTDLGVGALLLAAVARDVLLKSVAQAPRGLDAPLLPTELEPFTYGPTRLIFTGPRQLAENRSDGIDFSPYLYVDLRRELRDPRSGGLGLFVGGGLGVLPRLARSDASRRAAAGVHLSIGLRSGHSDGWTLSLVHVQGLVSDGYRASWTGLRFAFVLG